MLHKGKVRYLGYLQFFSTKMELISFKIHCFYSFFPLSLWVVGYFFPFIRQKFPVIRQTNGLSVLNSIYPSKGLIYPSNPFKNIYSEVT